LEQPNRLEQEYRQRLAPADEHAADHTTLELQRTKLRHGLTRLIDSYTEGFLEKQEFESRITRQRQRIAALDEQIRQFADAASTQRELRLLIGRLEDFAAQVENGLDTADWPTRRELIRTLVSRVEIDHTQVKVMFRVPPDPFVASPDRLDRGVLQHCRRGDHTTLGDTLIAGEHFSTVQNASFEPLPQQLEHPSVANALPHKFQEQVVIDSVVERFDVQLHDPVRAAIDRLAQLLHCLVGIALRSEPVRAVSESGFENWLKHRLGGTLNHPISDCGYA
jgi:uncharacterized coiled-coil protein SlyX